MEIASKCFSDRVIKVEDDKSASYFISDRRHVITLFDETEQQPRPGTSSEELAAHQRSHFFQSIRAPAGLKSMRIDPIVEEVEPMS